MANGTVYTAGNDGLRYSLIADSNQLALTATADTITQGGQATVNITAGVVDQRQIEQLWTD